MAYNSSKSLSFETASKLGHLSVVRNPFIQQMLGSFEQIQNIPSAAPTEGIEQMDLEAVEPLDFILAVDGSMSSIPNNFAPQKQISYIKIAALNISMEDFRNAQAPIVNPRTISSLLSRYADTESTVLPLSNVRVPGKTLLESLREAISATFTHFAGGRIYDTLRFLVSYEWDSDAVVWKANDRQRPNFDCPFCGTNVAIPRSQFDFNCPTCNASLTLIDYLGLLMECNENSNDDAVSINLMGVLEHLTLINFLRELVERGEKFCGRVLLLKDGPLMLRGQYSRLVDPIRGYLKYLHSKGIKFFVAGVEKSGPFLDYVPEMADWFSGKNLVFVPQNRYILERIKHSGNVNTRYGEKVLYGSKVYFRPDERNVIVLNVPNAKNNFDHYQENPSCSDLIGLSSILKSISPLISTQHQNALTPIVAVNRIASMSFYPSNNILERFADAFLSSSSTSRTGSAR